MDVRSGEGGGASDGPVAADASRDSSPDFWVVQAKATRKRALVAGAILLVALMGGAALVISLKRSAHREAQSLASELRGCLLGGPLDGHESAAQRFRRLQLRVLSRPDVERGESGNKLWPLSCREATLRMLERVKSDASEKQRNALASLDTFLSDGGAFSKNASQPLDAALGTLDALLPGPVTQGKEPLPDAVLNVDTLASRPALSTKGTALSRAYTEDNPGLSLPVLVDEEGLPAPLLCVFHPSEADASCRSLSELGAVRGHGLRLLGTADPDAQTLVFAGRRGSEGVFSTGTSTPIGRLYSFGGYASRDGSAAVLGWDEASRSLVLLRRAPAGEIARTELKPNFRVGNYFYGSQLLWDQVLVRGWDPLESTCRHASLSIL